MFFQPSTVKPMYITSLCVVATLYITITGLFSIKFAFNFCKVYNVLVYGLHMYMLWFKFFFWFEFLCFLPVHNDQQIGSLSINYYLIITDFIQKLITLIVTSIQPCLISPGIQPSLLVPCC